MLLWALGYIYLFKLVCSFLDSVHPGVELLGHMVVLFRNLHIAFCSGCTHLHSHQECKRIPLFPHPHQYLLFVFFLMIAILIGVGWYLRVVLVCISLMISNVEFHVSVGHLYFFLEKCLFSSSAHFLSVFFFCCCCCWVAWAAYIYIEYHWKRPWCWERLKAGREGDDREWDGWMASPTLWTWIWANSGSWLWTGKSGMLQSMGWQRAGHDWATELTNWLASYLSSFAKSALTQ